MTSRADSERLAILVHEVRSPVAALAAVAEAAADSTRGEPDALRVLVRLALASCHAIERLVVDAAIASVRLEQVDVTVLVRDAVAAHVVRRSDVVLTAEDGLVVDGDPVRLRQVVDNLIANALAHGGPEVAVRISQAEGAVQITVSDAGLGIPSHELERIFDAGVRLADDTPGSGLGLALGRAIVEAHGGSLVARSSPATGSTFTIALPAARTHPDTAASSS
jgi:signal transduction histidine kinase